MSQACAISTHAGAVRALLGSVDCNTRDFAHRGYEAITGGEAFQTGLTLVLTIYVALVGYRLLFASEGARLTDGPRMALKVGAVLALVTSWNLFETLVFDVAAKTPAEIASLISLGSGKPGEQDPIGRLQVAYDQLTASAVAFAAQAQNAAQTAAQNAAGAPGASPPPSPIASPAPNDPADAEKAETAARGQAAARALTVASGAVLTVDAGAVAVANVVLGILGAIGPIFVTLLLFDQTRGFFEGWVRALAAAGLALMSAWVLILLMTSVLEPWLVALAQQRELKQLEPATAMTAASIVFVFTAAQLAMVSGSAVIAFGFRLTSPLRFVPGAAPAARAPEAAEAGAPLTMVSRASLLADQLRRFDAVVEGRGRAAATGLAAGSMRLAAAEPAAGSVFSGPGHRRTAPSRGDLARRGEGR